MSFIFCRNYGEENKKPLLDSPDKEDSNSGWGWGDKDEQWEGWSNEQSTGFNSNAPQSKDSDGWDNDGWGPAPVSNKTSSKKPSSKKPKATTTDYEAATGNLIDFGGESKINNGTGGSSWDNEVWAADDEEEDAWQALELESSSTKKD